jgi:hypothetical protein
MATLDQLLEQWTVLSPGMWENDTGPKDWHAVANDDGIIAYFANEIDALRFRLDSINLELNPSAELIARRRGFITIDQAGWDGTLICHYSHAEKRDGPEYGSWDEAAKDTQFE